MNSNRLNITWNADPNAPEVEMTIDSNIVTLEFFLNCLAYKEFKEGDKGRLRFKNCHKYSFNTMNDEGYYLGQYRYKVNELPWGEFYELNTNCKVDFPVEHKVLSNPTNQKELSHYIFFFKDNTFECIAESYEIEFIRDNIKL